MSLRPEVLLTIPPRIALAAPPTPSPPNISTVGPPQKDGSEQSGFVYGEFVASTPIAAKSEEALAFAVMF